MKKVFGKAIDNAISLGVVIIVLFLIIPIRTELLDFLLGRPDPTAEVWPDKYLIYGHTPTRLLREQMGEPISDEILRRGNQIAIDCGCGYDGRLGCLCLDTLEERYV